MDSGVSRLARKMGIPVVAIVGSLGEGFQAVHNEGIAACFSIASGPMGIEEAISQAAKLLASRAEEVLRLFVIR